MLIASPDDSGSHRRFCEKHALKIRLISDPGHEVLAKYGAWGEKKLYGKTVEGVIRSTVLIDPAGNVAHRWPRVRAEGHAREVLEKLREIQRKARGGR